MLLNLFMIVFLNLLTPVTSNRVAYSIREQSSLTLAGSSNVNEFECTTYDNFSNGYVYIISEENKEVLNFNNAVLKINVKSFDCHNPMMNKDFYKTLNAKESPTIDVELLSAVPLSGGKILKSQSGSFIADVSITLNNNSKADEIVVEWEKTGYNVFRFRGEKKIQMSDFGIESPVAALGLIKVNDEIKIYFDLYVQAFPKIM